MLIPANEWASKSFTLILLPTIPHFQLVSTNDAMTRIEKESKYGFQSTPANQAWEIDSIRDVRLDDTEHTLVIVGIHDVGLSGQFNRIVYIMQ